MSRPSFTIVVGCIFVSEMESKWEYSLEKIKMSSTMRLGNVAQIVTVLTASRQLCTSPWILVVGAATLDSIVSGVEISGNQDIIDSVLEED